MVIGRSFAQDKGNVPPPEPPPVTTGYFTDLDRAILHADKVEGLNLRDKQLSEVPAVIATFKNLEILDLSHNSISKVPSFLKGMKNLRMLYLNSNKLTEVNELIADCSN